MMQIPADFLPSNENCNFYFAIIILERNFKIQLQFTLISFEVDGCLNGAKK